MDEKQKSLALQLIALCALTDGARTRSRRRAAGSALALVALLAACGGTAPEINSVSVNPSTIQLSGIASNVTFAVSCNVLHFANSITSVTASVENQNITVNLTKSGGVVGDEQWTGTAQETLFNGFSAGVYQIDVTATDSSGVTTTDKAAATVTITN